MTIKGFELDNSVLTNKQEFDAYAYPYFHKGCGKNEKTGCIVTHGIGGTTANVRLIADALSEKGYTVYAPLLKGHGTDLMDLSKATWKDWVNDEIKAYDLLKKEGCTQIVAIGLSLGGILTGYIAEERECVCAVLLSPPVCMKTWLHVGRYMSYFVKGICHRDARKTEDPRLPYSQMYKGFSTRSMRELYSLIKIFRRNLHKISCPVTVYWAEKDDKVAERSMSVLEKHLKHVDYRSTVIKNARHGSTYDLNVRDEVTRLVVEYVGNMVK